MPQNIGQYSTGTAAAECFAEAVWPHGNSGTFGGTFRVTVTVTVTWRITEIVTVTVTVIRR